MSSVIWFVWIFALLLAIAYAAVLPFGAPFLPTRQKQGGEALDLLDLKKGQVFVDLGCGDGRLLKMAAERGLTAIGYELNPFLAAYAWLRTRRYHRRVRVKWRSFWRADLAAADGVFVFLIGHFMERLDKLLTSSSKDHQIKLASHAFEIPARKPIAKKGALFLYVYKPTTRD